MKREEQFKERLEYMCRSFPGVRGRVIDLCKVRQRQYELAITVVMESNMDAVVVDREETVKRSAPLYLSHLCTNCHILGYLAGAVIHMFC
jgi:chromosome segregation ATPase